MPKEHIADELLNAIKIGKMTFSELAENVSKCCEDVDKLRLPMDWEREARIISNRLSRKI